MCDYGEIKSQKNSSEAWRDGSVSEVLAVQAWESRFDPHTEPTKSNWLWCHVLVFPVVGRQRQVVPWTLVPSLSSLIV